MHDGDKLRLEPGLHITGEVFDGGGDGVLGGERGVYDDAKVFDLEVGLIQGFEGASIIEVVVERHSKVGVSDGGDQCGVFGGGRE